MTQPAIVWFRNDLRFADNPALSEALATRRRRSIPVYILDDEAAGAWRAGGAARWWLHGSLASLQRTLGRARPTAAAAGGDSLGEIDRLVAESGAGTRPIGIGATSPGRSPRTRRSRPGSSGRGIQARSHNGSLGREPWEVLRAGGEPYKVFTPFWRAWASTGCLARTPAGAGTGGEPVAPDRGGAGGSWPCCRRRRTGPAGLRETWEPGEAAAWTELDGFVEGRVGGYKCARDFPADAGVSRLSPRLHHGELSPRQIWHRAQTAAGAEAFLRQLVWREFAYHLLFHFPHLPDTPLRPEFARFPWADEPGLFRAWSRGRTGYPLVDAGMRELWHTGYMHNRVRMIAASFLTKDLLHPWQQGAAWFWDTLCDADLANNSMGWQWVAGCGTDAAPYFRIFNPASQGGKFDPDGAYVRRWVPELAGLPDDWIHEPAAAPADELARPVSASGKRIRGRSSTTLRHASAPWRRYQEL